MKLNGKVGFRGVAREVLGARTDVGEGDAHRFGFNQDRLDTSVLDVNTMLHTLSNVGVADVKLR